jgi:hypothetical protein
VEPRVLGLAELVEHTRACRLVHNKGEQQKHQILDVVNSLDVHYCIRV